VRGSIEMDLSGMGWVVDGTGSGSCPVAGFGISGVEPWRSAATLYIEYNVSGSVLKREFCVP
jgi:hypothetical protein